MRKQYKWPTCYQRHTAAVADHSSRQAPGWWQQQVPPLPKFQMEFDQVTMAAESHTEHTETQRNTHTMHCINNNNNNSDLGRHITQRHITHVCNKYLEL